MAVRVFLVALLVGLPQSPADWPLTAELDSLAAALHVRLATLTTPELEARREARREMQRHAYAAVLQETIRGDGVLAFLAWLRSMLQLEYALPRNTLVIYVSPEQRTTEGGMLGLLTPPHSPPVPIPLLEDRAFPGDPWKREKNK